MWTIPGLLCLVAASEAPRAERRQLDGYNVQEVAKLTATDASSNDEFGRSVAIDGVTVVVGTRFKEAAYVLRTTDGGATYVEVAKLTASDATAGDWFGRSVAIDGDTVVIGAPWDDDGSTTSGSAYVFRTSDGGQVAKLTAADAAASDNFGWAVAIAGNTVVIGAYQWNNGGSGAVYVFRTTNGGATYGQVAKLTASDAAVDDRFGFSVAIYGNTIVVGAYYYPGTRLGSAYVFRTTDGGAAYGQVAKLTASDAALGDAFGRSVAIDGETFVVGAYGDDDSGSKSGSVYVFRTSDGGATYGQVAKLTASDGAANDHFGYSVAIAGDTIVIGTLYGNAAYVFRTTDGGTTYVEVAKLTAGAGGNFGWSVAMDGTTVVVGSPNDGGGSANVFSLPAAPTPQPTVRPTSSPGSGGDGGDNGGDKGAVAVIAGAVAAVTLLLLLVGASCFFYGRSKGSVAEPSGGNSRPEPSPQPLKELLPAEEAAVVSVAPEAEEPPPPPTKGWFGRAEPEVEPEAEEPPRQEIAVEEEPLPPPAKSWWFRRAEPEPEAEDAERPPPLSPFSTLRAEREQELAFEPEA